MIIGIQGIQGSGKTTIARQLCDRNDYSFISLDDFYHSNNYIEKLYYFTKNPDYKNRGNPGTHDIKLLKKVLCDFLSKKKTYIPIYDKYALNGKGDRVGWKELKCSDVLIIEGWCLGFISKQTKTDVDNSLVYYEEIYKYIS